MAFGLESVPKLSPVKLKLPDPLNVQDEKQFYIETIWNLNNESHQPH